MRNTHGDKRRFVKKENHEVRGVGSGIKIAEPELTSQVIPAWTKAPGALLNAACGGPEGARPRDGPSNPGLRSGKAGCRIPADLKRGNGGEGTAQRRFCWPGAGGVGGAAGSAPDTFAVTEASVDENAPSERNPSTLHKAPQPERTKPFHLQKRPRYPKRTAPLPFNPLAPQVLLIPTREINNLLRGNLNNTRRQRAHKLTVVRHEN